MNHSCTPNNEDLEQSIPLSNVSVPKVKIRIRETQKDIDEVEKCIENEYRKSIITYSPATSKPTRKGWKRYIGVFAAFLTGLSVSLNILFVRLLVGNGYHPLTISVWRFVGNIPLTFTLFGYFLIRQKGELFQSLWPLTTNDKDKWIAHVMVALNGILSWFAVMLRYYSLQYMTLADSTVIVYSSPVMVVILAHIFLKEKCGIVSILTSVIAVIGVAVIARPPIFSERKEFDTDLLIGIALATSSMLGGSIVSIAIRKVRHIHFSVMILIHGFYGLFFSFVIGICLGVLERPSERTNLIYTGGLIISAFAIQVFVVLALKFEEAARVTLIQALEIVLSFIWQYLFLDTSPDVYSLIGSIIIASTVVITLARKWLEGLPEENKARKWCCCLLK